MCTTPSLRDARRSNVERNYSFHAECRPTSRAAETRSGDRGERAQSPRRRSGIVQQLLLPVVDLVRVDPECTASSATVRSPLIASYCGMLVTVGVRRLAAVG